MTLSVAEAIREAAHRELGPHLEGLPPTEARLALLRVAARQLSNITMDIARIVVPIMHEHSREQLAVLLSILRTYENLAATGELNNTSWDKILSDSVQFIVTIKAECGASGAN